MNGKGRHEAGPTETNAAAAKQAARSPGRVAQATDSSRQRRAAAARRLPPLGRCAGLAAHDPLLSEHEAWRREHDRRMCQIGWSARWQRERSA